MNHLKKISELYKSTYISAANKLKRLSHNKRSHELEKWADRRGINSNVDRIDAHRYYFGKESGDFSDVIFCGPTKMSDRAKLGPFSPNFPFFQITNVEFDSIYISYSGYTEHENLVICLNIFFTSNYGDIVKLKCSFLFYRNQSLRFHMRMITNHGNFNFLFDNRRDAMKLKSFIVDFVIPELNSKKIQITNNSICGFLESFYDITSNIVPFDLIKKVSINNYYETS